MNTERKLATILATDCVNFSKHMEEGEELTLSNLNECRKIIDEIIDNYGGKIFSTETLIFPFFIILIFNLFNNVNKNAKIN